MQPNSYPKPVNHLSHRAPILPINAQTWGTLSLLHWVVPVDQVQALLPRGLIVDEYEGQTWLGVVPFVMSDVRVPPLLAFGRSSTFPELNVRVYVHDLEGNRGVWFLGLWCSSSSFVAVTRALGIPYHRAISHAGIAEVRTEDQMQQLETKFDYRFLRSGAKKPASNIHFSAKVRSVGDADASSGLEAWLTARWNMFAVQAGGLWRYPVHHEPWQLRTGVSEGLQTNVHERFGFVPTRILPLVHTAEPVHTLISAPKLCRR